MTKTLAPLEALFELIFLFSARAGFASPSRKQKNSECGKREIAPYRVLEF